MYDCDVSHFDQVFASTAQLHGFREGASIRERRPTLTAAASGTLVYLDSCGIDR